MKSTPKRTNRKPKRPNRLFIYFTSVIIILLLVGVGLFIKGMNQNDDKEVIADSPTETGSDESAENDNAPNENEEEQEPEPEPEETFIDIRIAAAGDIMVHGSQIDSAYNPDDGTYDFKSVFEDVKPIFGAADMSIVNFETTTAGSSRPYVGYPQFNSPDEIVDAIKYAGIDVLTTVNNHSLDTGSEGLKRTVEVIRDKGIENVGTYDEKPDSRVLIKDVKGIKLAILAYTESTNGLGDQYPQDELDSMLNLMKKDNIRRDIQEAKELEADFIITFMHWGQEYMQEPNETQVDFAHMMADEGVDLILGAHPHVIQKTDVIEANDKETFVVYSMGNFVSNQRKETLGDHREITEDGIIINFDIRKNELTGETTLEDVEYVPTWVYRDKEQGRSTYTYRILPIENFLISDEISEAFKGRMERSLDATISKMYEGPVGEN